MAAAPEQFEGFMIKSTDKWSDFSKEKVIGKLFCEAELTIT